MKIKSRISLTPSEARAKKHLRNCFLDGQYITERATEFWSKRDADDCLAGERKTMGSELICQPLRLTDHALLVMLTDTKGNDWFSWIHP